MYCILTLTLASMKMFLRNRQALFFSLFMPAIILFIFGSMNFDRAPRVHLGLAVNKPSARVEEFLSHLQAIDGVTIDRGSHEEELAALASGNRSAVLEIPDDLGETATPTHPRELPLYINGGRPVEAQMAQVVLNQFIDRSTLRIVGAGPIVTLKPQSKDAHNFRYIEFLLPGIIAMSIMQMSVFSVAFVFAQYKEKGILKRLLATPMRPYQFVTANLITRLCMALIQGGIFIVLGIFMFKVPVAGSIALLILSVTLGALMFLGLGFTISGLAKTIDTVPVLANILVFPMLFLGSVFFPDSSMPAWLAKAASYLPLSYFTAALRGVISDGKSFSAILPSLMGMTVWAVILIATATFTFRFQEREPG